MKREVQVISLGIAVIICSPSQGREIEAGAIADAGAKYQQNCMSCHEPPDLRFASDRAWLGQIRETA